MNTQHTNTERLFSPPLAGVGGGLSAAEVLRTITIHNRPIQIIATPDHHSLMQKAYQLWYQVYIEELKYPQTEGVNHDDKTLSLPPNGSIIFMAMDGEECVGTLRATYGIFSPLEMNYSQWIPNRRLGEMSKMIVKRKYRKGHLNAYIMIECFDYNRKTGNENFYEVIVCNATHNLLPYYLLFGYKKLTRQYTIHPIIGNKCYVLKWEKTDNENFINDLRKVVNGSVYIKAKWAIEYWWYKNISTK